MDEKPEPVDFYGETAVEEYNWQLKCATDPFAMQQLKIQWGMV